MNSERNMQSRREEMINSTHSEGDGILYVDPWITSQELITFISNNKVLIAVIAFLYLLPLTTTATFSPIRALLFLITQIMIFGLLAMSFDLQLGRAGLLNFGQVALFGVGAYLIAFTLNPDILPYPLNLIAIIPYPLTIGLAMMVGASVGFIMGLTTSRMKGTAFAFIALAIAMFLYNFFVESPDISGGETGLRIAIPDIIKTAPFYLIFVSLTVIFLVAFLGMVILYLKERRETIGLMLFILIMIALTGILVIFGTNIIGPVIVFIAFLGMIVLYWIERNRTISDPLQFSENETILSREAEPINILLSSLLPFVIIIIGLIGLFITFWTNILQMVTVWIEQTDTFYFTIPDQYYLVLTCVVATFIFLKRLVASPFGRMVVAVAQNEERAEALGYNSYLCKIVVVVISGAIAGLGGALYAPFIRTIDPPTALGVEVSINAMLYTIVGGLGTLFGPLLGTGVVVYSELRLVDFIKEGLNLPGELWLVALGIIYVLIVLFMPQGIVGTIKLRALPLKEKLLQLKIGQFELGIREADYWVFALLGAIGLFLLLLILSL
ncbi:MAG: branched-chain amino acid ABC transporter permease [Promethearchaeota archaeon]